MQMQPLSISARSKIIGGSALNGLSLHILTDAKISNICSVCERLRPAVKQ